MVGTFGLSLLVLSNCLGFECVVSVNPRGLELGLLDYSLPVSTLSAERVLSNVFYSATDNSVFVKAGQTIVKLVDNFTSHVTFSRPEVALPGVVRKRMFEGLAGGRFLDCTTTTEALVCGLEMLANGTIHTWREIDITLHGLADISSDHRRLYIARSVGNNKNMPEIEIRKLNDLSQIRARVPLVHGISIIDNSRYEFGFATSTYVYFIRTSNEGSRQTFLERFCIIGTKISGNHSMFSSYSRLPLTCYFDLHNFRYFRTGHMGLVDGYHALIAVFSDSPSGSDVSGRSQSALCVFGIGDIDNAFRRNIQKCFNGSKMDLSDVYDGDGTAIKYGDVRCSSCHPSVRVVIFTFFIATCIACYYDI